MREAIVAAVIAAWPPTVAAALTFANARRSEQRATQERAALVDRSLESLHESMSGVRESVDRVEGIVTDLRERVARLEGAQAAGVRGA